MNYKNEYKKLLMKSLEEDIDKWVIQTDGCMDVTCTYYRSPIYKNNGYGIEFYLHDRFINLKIDVFIRGKEKEDDYLSIFINPFSKLYTLICNMKKHLENKEISKRNSVI